MRKRVLITGGAGFLGVNLARKLLHEGYEVTLFDLFPLKDKDLGKKITFILGDIQKKDDVRKAVQGQHSVIHTAALLFNNVPKEQMFDVNVGGTKNILDMSRIYRVKRIVFISSTSVYGTSNHPDVETDELHPSGYYAESKMHAEILCRESGLPVTILRPRTFLGPGRLGPFKNIFQAIHAGRPVLLLGNGNNYFQFLSVIDLIDAIIKAMVIKNKFQIINIGSKRFGTWRTDVRSVIQYAKSKSSIIGLPVRPVLDILQYIPNLKAMCVHYSDITKDSYVSIARAEQMLHWQPKLSDQELLIASYDKFIKSL